MADERIGLIGPGRMGLAMVKHLIEAGYAVTVTDIDERRLEAAAKEGAAMAVDAAALGASTDYAIVAVGYDDETRDNSTDDRADRRPDDLFRHHVPDGRALFGTVLDLAILELPAHADWEDHEQAHPPGNEKDDNSADQIHQ